MERSSVKEAWNEEERGRPQILTACDLPPLFQFFSHLIPLFMPSLLPVHLEKASHLPALYSTAAPARALAGIFFRMFVIYKILCVD